MKIKNILRNMIIGFILFGLPILIIELEAMIVQKYTFSYIYAILYRVFEFGVGGLVLSIIYTYLFIHYPKISKYLFLFFILTYYLLALVILFIAIYFQFLGPLD